MPATPIRLLFVAISPDGPARFPGIKLIPAGTESISGTAVLGHNNHPVMIDNGDGTQTYINYGTFSNYFEYIKTSDLSHVGGVAANTVYQGSGATASDFTNFYWISNHQVTGSPTFTRSWILYKFAVPSGALITSWDLTSIIPEATDSTPDAGFPKRVWSFPSSLAVDPSGNIIYLAITTGSAQTKPTTIRKIVLSTLTPTTFYTIDPSDLNLCMNNALLTFRDGTLLAATRGTSGLFNSRIVRLSTSGVVLNQYPFHENSFNNALLMQIGRNDNSFWVGSYDPVMSNGYDFRQWDRASGALLNSLSTDLNAWPSSGGQNIDPDVGWTVDYLVTPDAPIVTDIIVECTTKNITIIGSNFPDNPTVILTRDGVPVEVTPVFSTDTIIVVNVPDFQNGKYCAYIKDTTLQTSDGFAIYTSDNETILVS